jgi:UDP-3-O-[3-hydroxymyristoyl] glucosamine N-acyltransferase
MNAQTILNFLDGQVRETIGTSGDKFITAVAPVLGAPASAITFICAGLSNGLGLAYAMSTRSRVVLCPNEHWVKGVNDDDKLLIIVDDPYRQYIQIVNRYFAELPPVGIHITAWIADSVHIDESCYIGAFVSIHDACTIGQRVVIHDHVTIYPHTTIADDVTIHAGAVIGADGFGFSHTNRDIVGGLIRFPHVGGVTLEQGAEIGANTCIDRGTLGDTYIRRGAKIDNLVHIAHNADIGPDTAVVANAMIAGSVKVGGQSWVAPSASIRDRLFVGEDALIELGAVVVKNVDDHTTVAGMPAEPLDDHLTNRRKLKEVLNHER